jgi:hypothetical protein
MTTIFAPFSEEQVKRLQAWQTCELTHPYTCCTNELNNQCRETLEVHVDGLKCPKCGYVQNWAGDPGPEFFEGIAKMKKYIYGDGT